MVVMAHCHHRPGHHPTISEQGGQSSMLITRSITSPRKSKVMNQVQGPSRESSQEQQEMEADTGLEARLQHGSAGDRTQGKLPTR